MYKHRIAVERDLVDTLETEVTQDKTQVRVVTTQVQDKIVLVQAAVLIPSSKWIEQAMYVLDILEHGAEGFNDKTKDERSQVKETSGYRSILAQEEC